MKEISCEKMIEIAEHIIRTFQKNTASGYIAFRSLENYSLETKAWIMYKVSIYDTTLPEDLREKLFEETGHLFENHMVEFDKNIPVKKLIELFKNKDSGQVKAAVKQLKERFLHLDYKDQVRVMTLFLDSSVSYRKWCYRTLAVWREPKYDDVLVSHWFKYFDDCCLQTIVEVLPEDRMKELYPHIRQRLDNTKYSRLLERFGMAPWVDVDKTWLMNTSPDIYHYLRIISVTRTPLTESECAEILYDYLQESFSEDNIELLWKVNERHIDNNHNTATLCFQIENITVRTTSSNAYAISSYLKLFAMMEHYDLVTGIISWGNTINRLLPHDDIEEDYEGTTRKDRFLAYIRLLRENMPTNFEGISQFPACDYSTKANESELLPF